MPFRLKASANLSDWEAVVSDVALENGISFIEDDRADYPQRFYRTVEEFGDPDTDD